VLFEFTDLNKPDTIRASIWRVDTKAPGFAYCIIDYYKNIRAASSSKAPFNLWPFQLKFDLMRPVLIYQSYINQRDEIHTKIFPERDAEQVRNLQALATYAQSQNLTLEKIVVFAQALNANLVRSESKRKLLEQLQNFLDHNPLPPQFVIDQLAKALYLPEVRKHLKDLPRALRERTETY